MTKPRNPVARRRWLPLAALTALTLAIGTQLWPPTTATPAQAVEGAAASRVISGPSGLELTVTPGDLSQVKQGDIIKLKMTGIKKNQSVNIGTCPKSLQADYDRLFLAAFGHNCTATLATGIGGDTGEGQLGASASTSITTGWARTDGSLAVDFLVGRGQSLTTMNSVYKDFTEAKPFKFSCDEKQPCNIGVAVSGTSGFFWTDITSLEFAPKDAQADQSGCSGLGTDTVKGFGPERLQGLFTNLNRLKCKEDPGPIPVSYVGLGESDQLAEVGITRDLAIAGSPLYARKPTPDTLAIPLALNAVSLAQFGGTLALSNTPGQFAATPDSIPALALNPADVADITLHRFGRDRNEIPPTPAEAAEINPLAASLVQKPENSDALAGFDAGHFGLPLNRAPVVAYSVGPDSTAVALSSYLTDKATSNWIFPKLPSNIAANRADRAVGRIASFDEIKDAGVGDSGPLLTSQVSSTGGLFSAIFNKDLDGIVTCPVRFRPAGDIDLVLAKGCLRFVIVDQATSSTLSLTPARLATTSGYVAPTADSLTAAAGGTLNADGYFASDSADAYPLTFVEYAIVPKAPLVDDKCKPRAAQQAELLNFLKVATQAAPEDLPAGFATLPASLKEKAAAEIAKIGTGPATGKCAPKKSTTATGTKSTSPSTTDDGSGISGNGDPSGGGTGSTSDGSGDLASGSDGASGAAPPAEGATGPSGGNPANSPQAAADLAKTEAVSATLPGFGGFLNISVIKGMIGLFMLILLTSVATGLAGQGPQDFLAQLRRKAIR